MFYEGLLVALLVAQVICTTPWLHGPFMGPNRGPTEFLKQLGPARGHDLEFFSQKQDHFDPANTEVWPQVVNLFVFLFTDPLRMVLGHDA